jgi:type II secretory pathway pseudopilin PulG
MGSPPAQAQLHDMPGYTLLEAIFVVTLLAIGASVLAKTARRLSDLSAVLAAREEVVGAVLEARAGAVGRGGRSVVLTGAPPSILLGPTARRSRRVLLSSGVSIDLGGRDSTELRFDGLGIGRFASQTVVLRRGGASAAVVLSSYGRVRRR